MLSPASILTKDEALNKLQEMRSRWRSSEPVVFVSAGDEFSNFVVKIRRHEPKGDGPLIYSTVYNNKTTRIIKAEDYNYAIEGLYGEGSVESYLRGNEFLFTYGLGPELIKDFLNVMSECLIEALRGAVRESISLSQGTLMGYSFPINILYCYILMHAYKSTAGVFINKYLSDMVASSINSVVSGSSIDTYNSKYILNSAIPTTNTVISWISPPHVVNNVVYGNSLCSLRIVSAHSDISAMLGTVLAVTQNSALNSIQPSGYHTAGTNVIFLDVTGLQVGHEIDSARVLWHIMRKKRDFISDRSKCAELGIDVSNEFNMNLVDGIGAVHRILINSPNFNGYSTLTDLEVVRNPIEEYMALFFFITNNLGCVPIDWIPDVQYNMSSGDFVEWCNSGFPLYSMRHLLITTLPRFNQYVRNSLNLRSRM